MVVLPKHYLNPFLEKKKFETKVRKFPGFQKSSKCKFEKSLTSKKVQIPSSKKVRLQKKFTIQVRKKFDFETNSNWKFQKSTLAAEVPKKFQTEVPPKLASQICSNCKFEKSLSSKKVPATTSPDSLLPPKVQTASLPKVRFSSTASLPLLFQVQNLCHQVWNNSSCPINFPSGLPDRFGSLGPPKCTET